MPTFTFHIENGHRISSDIETLPTKRAALLEAKIIARELSKNSTAKRKSRLVVTDHKGMQVAILLIG
jgi:hypothetical protein